MRVGHNVKVEIKVNCGNNMTAWEDQHNHGDHVVARVYERQTFVGNSITLMEIGRERESGAK
eukprot:4943836-Ditylum_brightwellii.AAC.1